MNFASSTCSLLKGSFLKVFFKEKDPTGVPESHLLSSLHQFQVMQDMAFSVYIQKVQACKGSV